MAKTFKLPKESIRPIATGYGSCFATDRITVDGARVGYMYRESPDSAADSGWRFVAGDEDDDYMNDPDRIALYDVNTIANYDPEVIPLLESPVGSAFIRDATTNRFTPDKFDPPES